MPANLAGLLCAVFIFGMFVLDKKRKPRVSYALILPFIFLFIRGSRPFSMWLSLTLPGYHEQANIDDLAEGNSLDRLYHLSILFLGILILVRRKIAWGTVFIRNKWIFLIILMSLVSMLWSDYPFVTFKRWFKGLGGITMALIVLTEKDRIASLQTMVQRCAYILLPLSIIFIKYYRHLGCAWDPFGGLMYVGVSTGKNPLGLLCALCGFFAFWQLSMTWRAGSKKNFFTSTDTIINVPILIMVFYLLNKASSATSSFTMLIGITVYSLFGLSFFKKNPKKVLSVIIVGTCVFLPILLLGFNYILSTAVDMTGHSDTFWGRVDLWKLLITENQAIVCGVGYDSYFLGHRLETLWSLKWWAPTQAHNGYVGVYLDLGIVGLFLWCSAILCAYRHSIKTLYTNYDFGRFQLAFIIMFVLHNITEASLNLRSMLFFMFLLITLYYPPSLKPFRSRSADRRSV